MKIFLFSIIAGLVTFVLLSVSAPIPIANDFSHCDSLNVANVQAQSHAKDTVVKVLTFNSNNVTNLPDWQKFLLSLIGGILSGVAMKLLHHWWPNIYPDVPSGNNTGSDIN